MIAVLVCALALWIAAVLQQGLSPQVGLLGAQPDFLLVAVGALGLCLTRPSAAVAGFVAGVLQGALAGANLTHYVVSRTVAGFCTAWSRRLRFESTWLAVFMTIAMTTVVAQLLFMFTAAPRGIAEFLGDTIIQAMYNGVLAIPVYALLKRVLNPPVR